MFSAIGFGIRPAFIHLRIVPRCTPSNLAVSEIENLSVIYLCTMMVSMSRTKTPRIASLRAAERISQETTPGKWNKAVTVSFAEWGSA
jgi:hypothetical protein